MYSPQLLDHFENPRNAGTVESPEAAVQIENPVCGDILALSARISGGRIAEIKFKAKGCVPTMACASALTELASGKTIADAAAIKKEMLVAAVGGVPQASTHAAQLALDALASLLREAQRSIACN
jgi:nitrogen fixation NifU-like protein